MEELKLEDLIPITKGSNYNSKKEPHISINMQGISLNKYFSDKYLLPTEGYYALFEHPKNSNILLIGIYKDSLDVLPQHKSIVKQYTKDKHNGLTQLHDKSVTAKFGKQSHILYETVTIASKVFYLIMPDVKPLNNTNHINK